MTIPFPPTVLIDSLEKADWSFAGLCAVSAADKYRRPYQITTRVQRLGIGMGDYSLAGMQDRLAIERKSAHDLWGTLLGYRDRRDRFRRELENLACLDTAAIVVEASLGEVLVNAPEYGVKSAEENRRVLLGTYLAWSQEFRVPWIFADSRRLAEIAAFRILERFWLNHRHEFEEVGHAS